MKVPSALQIELQTPAGQWVHVGHVFHRHQKNWFEFVESYWAIADRPVLGQIFEEPGHRYKPRAHVALPRWFSHLLPEGRLRTAVAQAAHLSPQREFDLLARLGSSDLPGAIRALAVDTQTSQSVAPDLDHESDHDADDPLLKFSLAGAQLKFSIHGDDVRGLTVPAHGRPGNFIVKFPDSRNGFEGVPEAELGALELGRAAGISTPRAELVSPFAVAGLEEWSSRVRGKALMVARFDRKPGDQRIHMEELAQVMDIPTGRERAKYTSANFETVAIFAGALSGIHSVAEVIDRIVLNVLVGNGDAHLKNWAFIYPDGKRPQLSPLYDVVPTVLYLPDDDLGMNPGRSKRFADVTPASFDALGARSGIGASQARLRAAEAVERVLANWNTLTEYLRSGEFGRLTERLSTLKLVRR